ncbi:MAG TPA: dienelactone hydrolase family protein, partial [Bryobacteraceae bacterium]|nr:dienelactone hydrolase family protein [Bryobacteraceae bacterium]
TDRRGDKSADDRSFQIFKDLHSYEKTALNPKVELVDDSSPYLRREDVTIQAAYGNERVLVHLYLPKNTRPPFQALAMFGSGAMFTARSIAELHDPFEFIVRSGRAVFIPAYKGTLERGPMPSPSQGREAMLDWSKDLGRSLDYLETRPDIDRSKFGFYGYSVGAALSPRLIAVEPRIKAALLVSGGSVGRMPAEVDPWNFAPRVQIPVLMLNGRDDLYFPLENSQLPLFRALGTAEPYKKRVVYEGGHINLMTRLDLAKEALGWLDEYLGPVEDRPR